MFKKWFAKEQPQGPKAPEIMGLYLGGSFELDELKMRLLVPQLMIEQPATKHLIQAVGEAPLDSGGKMLRFYTDDDAFLQVILDGGDTENHITDVKLWYFYDTQTVGNDSQWQTVLSEGVSVPTYALGGETFSRVWNAVGEESPPIAVTEQTFEEDGDTSRTDQFMMLYEREIDADSAEYLLVAAEEKIVGYNKDRCVVISTGFDIQPTDIRING
ncbi:YjfK family protein [Alteromonas sp. ASW11-36]|uniref:YjfK family protein n=1 Tax=Alteromonas arenosi TaxID=3055817 RepID=A0ABT7SU02_9ALTE|nr:YjfK family protein [Alteromonas sp. ASW11-36]MDM7859673.1 YjfK family protein [Alteromonas sp. ASW11-36]